jgi:hypothetical protein
MGLALFAAGLAALTLTAGASAASLKPYSLVVCALGTSETCAPSPTSTASQPAAVPVGATGVSMTATFRNENKAGTGLNVGSANLTPPPGFTVTSASVSGVPPFACPSSCSASVVGNVVQLRSMAVPPGSAVTVTMSANTPATPAACTVASPCTWSVLSKQSNDFSGPPGNDLNVDTSTSTLNTVLAALEFSAQPHSARLGQAITDSDYNPPPPAGTGGPVKVAAADANGTPVSSYHGVVSLVLNTPNNPFTNPIPSTLGGTTSENATGGVAAFANLTVTPGGNGFTLTASTPDLPPSTTSVPFNVQQAEANCANNGSCSTQAASQNAATTDGGVDVTVSSTSGGASQLVETIDFGFWPAATRISECGEAGDHFTYEAFTSPRPLTSSITTTDLELTHQNFNASVAGQEICLAETAPFTAKVPSTTGDGDNDADDFTLAPAQPVTLPDGTQGFAGLEPDCGTGSNQVPLGTGPCVTSRSGQLNKPNGTGGTLTITDNSPTDRWAN